MTTMKNLSLLAASLALAACDPGGGTGTPPAPAGTFTVAADHPGQYAEEQSIAVNATLRTPAGEPIAGAVVHFVVTQGGGSVSVAVDTTDAHGGVSTFFRLGPVSGDNVLEARSDRAAAPGSVTVAVEPPRLTLGADSVVFGAEQCYREFEADVRRGGGGQMLGIAVQWTLLDPEGLAYVGANGYSGNYFGIRRFVRPVAPFRAGTARLVASWRGAADTVAVRLVPQGPRALVLGYGASRFSLRLGMEPLELTPTVDSDCFQVGVVPLYQVSDPAVVSVDEISRLQPLSVGTARIVGTYGAVADTVEVTVRDIQLLPADTTVYVGDTVAYRLRVASSPGDPQPAPITGAFLLEPSVGRADVAEDGVVTARVPGEAKIAVWVHGVLTTTRLTILPRP